MAVALAILGISLLLWVRGALKRDRSDLIAGTVVLLIALIIPGLVNRSSAVYSQVGFELIVFGVVALFLASRVHPLIQKESMRVVATACMVLGALMQLIL